MKKNAIDFKKGSVLVPAIIQDNHSKEILMLGYMNQESYERTIDTGFVFFWSRSRNRLWMKGEESGNTLKVEKIFSDCDADTLLISVQLQGNAVCHTGERTCFSTVLFERKI